MSVDRQAARDVGPEHRQEHGLRHATLTRADGDVGQAATARVRRSGVDGGFGACKHACHDATERDAPHRDGVLGAADVYAAIVVEIAEDGPVAGPLLSVEGAEHPHKLHVFQHMLPHHVAGVEEVGRPHVGARVGEDIVVEVAVAAAGNHLKERRRAGRAQEEVEDLREGAEIGLGLQPAVEAVARAIHAAHGVAHRVCPTHVARDLAAARAVAVGVEDHREGAAEGESLRVAR